MKIFIWQYVTYLTNNYHAEGGVAVIAETLESARAMLPHPHEEHACSATVEEPDAVYELAGPDGPVGPLEPRLFVFPDAGCC